MANKTASLLSSLTSLLKQVHLYDYQTNDDLESPVSSLDSLGFSPSESSTSLASADSISSEQDTLQAIHYAAPAFSIDSSSEYSQTHISESLESFTSFSYKGDIDYDDVDHCPPASKPRRENEPKLPEYSLNEVAQHDMMHDCWIVLYDKVYDVTDFLFEHPGGEELMMEHAGRDGTIAFRGVGHSKAALRSLQRYLIGELPSSERIFGSWEMH